MSNLAGSIKEKRPVHSTIDRALLIIIVERYFCHELKEGNFRRISTSRSIATADQKDLRRRERDRNLDFSFRLSVYVPWCTSWKSILRTYFLSIRLLFSAHCSRIYLSNSPRGNAVCGALIQPDREKSISIWVVEETSSLPNKVSSLPPPPLLPPPSSLNLDILRWDRDENTCLRIRLARSSIVQTNFRENEALNFE